MIDARVTSATADLRPASAAVDVFDRRLARFVTGLERDPSDSFALAADTWNLRAYAPASPIERAPILTFTSFGLLTPYLKWFVLDRCLLAGRTPDVAKATVSAARRAAEVIARLGIDSFEDLAAPDVFRRVWDGLIDEQHQRTGPLPRAAVWRQDALRSLFRATRVEFGAPLIMPSRARTARPSIALLGRADDLATPAAVVRALANRLALLQRRRPQRSGAGSARSVDPRVLTQRHSSAGHDRRPTGARCTGSG